MEEALAKAIVPDHDGVVRLELEYSLSEIRQLINQLPGRHPLVIRLREQEQFKYCVDKHVGESNSGSSTLTYLAEKLKVSSMEQLFSKALTFINWGLELEEKGFVVQAVKGNFFTKEVINFKIGG